MTTTEEVVTLPDLRFDHCPDWCTEKPPKGEERAPVTEDPIGDHCEVHATSTYSPAAAYWPAGRSNPFGAVYVNLERDDVHGKPADHPKPGPYIVLANDDQEWARLSIPEARSLARILVHLADLEEL